MRRLEFLKNGGDWEFTGKSGKLYKLQSSIATGRLPVWEKIWLEINFNMMPVDVFRENMKVANFLKSNNVFDAAVTCYRLSEGISRIADSKSHPFLKMCAVFFNVEGEDEGVLTDETIAQKVEDWSDIAVDDFFVVGGTLTPHFSTVYDESRENISKNVGLMMDKEEQYQKTIAKLKGRKEKNIKA